MTPRGRHRATTAAALAGIAVVALWIVWPILWFGPGEFYRNAEFHSHVYRIVEFRDLLRAGYLSPQWAIDFRGGLGSPYFGYYQPGLFYVAAVLAMVVPPVVALGLVTAAFLWIGGAACFGFTRRHAGLAGGGIAAATFLGSVYVGSEIFLRGDFAELAAMSLVPVLLGGLIVWLEDGRIAAWRAATLAAGLLPVLHGIAGMFAYALAAAAIGWWAVAGAERRRVAWAGTALVVGAGLAAFFWLPVAFEWNLVSTTRAFGGPFDFREHFVPPAALVGAYDPRYTGSGVPFSLGPLVPALVTLNVVLLALRRRTIAPATRRLAGFGVAAAVAIVFGMSAASTPLWTALPPLQKSQFPWRLLLVLTPVAALLAGCIDAWPASRARSLAAAAVVALALALSPTYRTMHGPHRYPPVASGAELAQIYFAPDLAEEWLPRGARVLLGGEDDLPGELGFTWTEAGTRVSPRAPDCRCLQPLPRDGPACEVGAEARPPGTLRWHVRTRRPCTVVLPQYFFPVGWQATVGDRPLALESDDRGLMRVALPDGTDADVVVRFHATPMRRLGLLVSGATALAWLAAAVARRATTRARRAAGGVAPAPARRR